ncbi:MAG: hypothetical protein WBQ26_09650 [Gemmatimonadaceae bacterium]|nr:hypothetical protein [Gemmatimonadaceae bacterium]
MTSVERSSGLSRAIRWRITLGLIVAGALAGAMVGVGITVLGKIVAGAPPADAANYRWNATVFGVLGACVGPLVTWSALRRVPLWRTITEPLVGALVGAGIGTLLGSGVLFLLLTPLGAGAAVLRLERRHRGRALPPG